MRCRICFGLYGDGVLVQGGWRFRDGMWFWKSYGGGIEIVKEFHKLTVFVG